MPRLHRQDHGFSLIEIIIVVAIMATIYAVAIPQFNVVTGAERAAKLGQLTVDIRSAFDNAVLSGFPHRMVFHFASGSYTLEVADRRDVFLADRRVGHDPTAEEEKNAFEDFEASMEELQAMAGDDVKIPNSDKSIKASSPLLKSKAALSPVRWVPIAEGEWSRRELGNTLVLLAIQAEHHGEKQTAADMGAEGRAMIYFFPTGYVEKAAIYIADQNAGSVDETKPSMTILTRPLEGDAEIVNAQTEVDFDDQNPLKK